MSEVLRAILDHNCIDSRPAFYCAQLTTPILAVTALGFGRRQVSFGCKPDTYFLAMGAAQDSAFFVTGGPYLWETKAFASTFQIVRGNNSEPFSISPQPTVLQNYNLNNFASWDEYALFDPAELITVVEDVRIAAGLLMTAYAFVTLLGVEYRMPARFDRSSIHG